MTNAATEMEINPSSNAETEMEKNLDQVPQESQRIDPSHGIVRDVGDEIVSSMRNLGVVARVLSRNKK